MNGNVKNGQWAKVPEWVAYKDLDATALNVLIIMTAKAGRDRVAWISNRTIAERLDVHRTTAGKAIRRLVKVGVLEEAGNVVVDYAAGTWVKKYRIVDMSPDLPEVRLERSSGQVSNQASDLPEVRPERSSVGAILAPSGVPDERLEVPDERLGPPDENPGRSHSVPLYQSLRYQSLLDAQFEIERDPNHKDQPKGASKEKEMTGFWWKNEWHPYGRSRRSAS